MTATSRTIGVVTVGRSDYGIYLPVLRQLSRTPGIVPWLFVSGTHLEERFGYTLREIEADGFEVRMRVPIDLTDDSALGVAGAMSRGVAGFARAFSVERPDLLIVLGDRFDMFPAAIAALPLRIPLAHIHGGETTEGATDESIRHAITKLSHLHFPSTDAYARRLEHLGEEPWRITVSGAPSLDSVKAMPRLDLPELGGKVGMALTTAPLLVTYHPATLQAESPAEQIAQVLGGLKEWRGPIIFTGVNADTGNRQVRAAIEEFVTNRAATRLVENLGTAAYFSLMAVAAAMVGNSSSGIIEAPTFELPVVNVGFRQRGRIRAANVIDAECASAEIRSAIVRATAAEFRRGLKGLRNPYGDGNASSRIVSRLANAPLGEKILTKKFHDVGTGVPS